MKEIYLVRGLKRISVNWTRNINTVVYLACLSAQSTGRRCAYRGIRFNSNPLHYYYELIVMRNGAIKLILIRIVTTRPLFASFYWLSLCDGLDNLWPLPFDIIVFVGESTPPTHLTRAGRSRNWSSYMGYLSLFTVLHSRWWWLSPRATHKGRESLQKLRHKTHKMKFFANIWHNFLVIINAFPSQWWDTVRSGG